MFANDVHGEIAITGLKQARGQGTGVEQPVEDFGRWSAAQQVYGCVPLWFAVEAQWVCPVFMLDIAVSRGVAQPTVEQRFHALGILFQDPLGGAFDGGQHGLVAQQIGEFELHVAGLTGAQ